MNYHDPIVLKACKGVAVTKLGLLLSPTNGYGVDILYNSVLRTYVQSLYIRV